jgi:hypothetical protein
MKTIIVTVALAAAVIASPASAASMCVQTRDIVSTDSKDGKLMTFKLRDGRILVNHLQGICTDLRFEGFAWTIRGPEEVCEFQQSLKVINSGQSCTLGKFDVIKEKRQTP